MKIYWKVTHACQIKKKKRSMSLIWANDAVLQSSIELHKNLNYSRKERMSPKSKWWTKILPIAIILHPTTGETLIRKKKNAS